MKNIKELSKKEIRQEIKYFQRDLGNPQKGWNLWKILRNLHYFLSLIIAIIDHDRTGEGSSG